MTTETTLRWRTMPDRDLSSRDYVTPLPHPVQTLEGEATHVLRWYNRTERSWVVSLAALGVDEQGRSRAEQRGSSEYVYSREDAEAEAARFIRQAEQDVEDRAGETDPKSPAEPVQQDGLSAEQAAAYEARHPEVTEAAAILRAEGMDPTNLSAENAEAILRNATGTTPLPEASVTADEAIVLLAATLPGFSVMQGSLEVTAQGGDDWEGVEDADEVDEALEQALVAVRGRGDPEAIVTAMRANNAVFRFGCGDSDTGVHDMRGNLCAGCLQYDDEDPYDGSLEHALGLHDDEALPGCPTCDRLADERWSEDYRERGILRDTFACVAMGSRSDGERFAFDLLAQGVEVRVRRDASDPDVWHVAVRGGLAGCPRAWVTTLRGEPDAEDILTCSGTVESGQHPIDQQ